MLLSMLVWVWALAAPVPAGAAADPAQGPGGPVLVVTSGTPTPGTYLAEILRNEGLNAFAVADIASVDPTLLASYDVVLLAAMTLTPAQATLLSSWVQGGGNLIALRPDAALAGLLGLSRLGTTLNEAYLRIDTASPPGNGLSDQALQYHGAADLYALNGATTLAQIYSTRTAATSHPALSLRSVGSGMAAAFSFDLAESIIQTRQGNPAWASSERDGFPPIRSVDKFFGNAAGDPRPDWVDLNQAAIPQADEQQRLLANLILHMNERKKPLPRFWYFPQDKKAVVLMSGDDHGNGGTAGRFDRFKALGPTGCSVDDWECVRGTSYIYVNTPLTDAQAAQYTADGFEVGLHIETGCADFTPASLQAVYARQVPDFLAKYPGVGGLSTQRHHCIVWSDWSTGAQVQAAFGMRLDTSYYFWPPGWVANRPGLFNGTAMPMRTTRPDGAMLDVYMAPTQMTDESGQSYPYTIDTLLDRALGPLGYYGVYTVNAHTDVSDSEIADAVVASARARGVPVVSARQLLTWLDGRNASTFSAIGYSGGVLGFTVQRDPAARGLRGLLPTRSGGGLLNGLQRSGTAVPFTLRVIKGVEYASFAAESGSYLATYMADTTPPQAGSFTPANGATDVEVAVRPSAVFNEAMNASSISSASVELRNAAGQGLPAGVSYNPETRTVTLVPASPLADNTSYTVTLRGGTASPRVLDAAGNALAANVSWTFTTTAGPVCPCQGFRDGAVPAIASVADPNAVELGVRFTSDLPGQVTGVRFYKGSGNTGTHVGNLWTATGQLLATATFVSETASGWQQVDFATPVTITAGTVYVASYFAPNGNYAADGLYFANQGVDLPPLHLLQDGSNGGGNGVYAYGASSSFPSSSYRSTNYWVDVVFTSGGTDITPPTVSSRFPAPGATGVPPGSVVLATFSEDMDPATATAGAFELRNTATSAVVPATLTYNSSTRTATLAPAGALADATAYTATLRGGTTGSGLKDLYGNSLAADSSWSFTTGSGCNGSAHAIAAENCLPGSPKAEWDISGSGDPGIQGFATQISVNRGNTVEFKVATPAAAYRFDIYRLGYYGGLGARRVATVNPTATLPQAQPACLTEAATGLIDCGNWAVSGSWAVPASAVSGIYLAKLVRADTGGASHIVFVVRDDTSTAELLFQTSDTTWQAYNSYGGNSLYTGAPAGRAYKVSYNRPFNTRSVDNGQDWLFNSEYPMLRWLEANGYNLSYTTGVDTDRSGPLLRNHKVFLSVGHDEYWSAGQRANVEAARDAGVHLAFFSGNEVFWKTRWESSIDGSATPYRTLVSYKETLANAKIDPSPLWTGTWRDPRFSPPADGGRPENALTGSLFMVNDGATTAIQVPEADGKMRFWRNTGVATLAPGTTATLPNGTLGYEWDVDADNGSRPPGLVRLSSTTVTGAPVLQDQGSTYAPGTANHALSLYRHASGARVFSAGTVQWAWGLDANHDRSGPAADLRMQQATVNLLADMQAQPATLQTGLALATASTDAQAPASVITTPAANGSVVPGTTVTIAGSASDTGGGVVGGVEVSVDGGASWRRASGRASWSYAWIPATPGVANIRTRAVDDSGNLEIPGPGRSVTVDATACPCSIWPATTTPAQASANDRRSVNVGTRFRVDRAGFITAIRFYKGSANTGTHVGSLWSNSGTRLASATFTGETATGWQQVTLPNPVAVTAGSSYVVSYLAPKGGYATNPDYFASGPFINGPLRALGNGDGGGNGIYIYANTTRFPTTTFRASNYWVDVVFTPAP